MKKTFLVFVFLGFICLQLVAQPGNYFLSHYKPGNDNISYLSFDIQQDQHGVLYFANQSGILQFDGRKWMVLPVHGAVYTLALSNLNEIFAGGAAGFGKIGLDHHNQLTYLSFSDSLPKAKHVFGSCALDSVIYFLNEAGLYQVDVSSSKASAVAYATEHQGGFTGLYRMTSGIYVSTENDGLMKLVNGELVPSDIGELVDKQIIFNEISPDGKKDLITTDDSRFYLKVNGAPLRELTPKDGAYLSANVVVNASWVTDKMLALGTLRGGVVFIDVESDETYEITNYLTGLPDNEIYAVLTDRNLGVWVAHDYGFTRIAPFLPFRTYNHYKGLQGNLLSVISQDDQVYVGTTLGLYLLLKEEIYEDEEYIVTKTVSEKVKLPTAQAVQDQKKNEVVQDRKKSKPGLFGIFKKKNKEEQEQAVEIRKTAEMRKAAEIKKTSETRTKKFTQKRTRRVLKGVEYVYKKVEGISGKVDQLVMVGNRLISGGVGGVFEVTGLKAVPISDDPVRLVFYSKSLNQILLSTYHDEIKSFQASKTEWKSVAFPDTLSVYADYMFEDNLQDLWICGHDRAIKLGIEDGEILDAERISLPHSSADRTVGLAFGPEVYLVQNGTFYHYASYKNEFIKNDSLPGPKKYFASAGFFWFYDGHKWRTVDPKNQGSIKTEWLSLFPDIRFLTSAEKGKSVWVITAANELYKFSGDQNQQGTGTNPLFLKEVKSHETNITPQKTWMIDEDQSALTMEFIQPEYVGEQAVEYRYWVHGLQDKWSEWSSINNIINFSFLPSGEYKISIQSKDLFDKITELDSIGFSVVPPYWKRPWFYALEFLFFGTLVVLSLKLNVANTKYRYLSRFLSALTVVMLIQFIQTIASANITMKSTPVADFFIQVFIALLVLPVEEFLRRRIVKAAEENA